MIKKIWNWLNENLFIFTMMLILAAGFNFFLSFVKAQNATCDQKWGVEEHFLINAHWFCPVEKK